MAVTSARRELGVVYTPREVSEPMVRLVLEPLLRGERDVMSLRICDPAIGEGAFLVEIVRVLADAIGGGRDARRQVAERCIHGVDIDPAAVARARAAVEEFVGAPVPALRAHLRTGDALAIQWGERFDALVGNPPYVRQERLANKAALRGFASYDGVADLYIYFIELAHRIADRWCVIVPNKWMSAAYGRPLRELLSRTRSIEGLVDFARALPLFADADAFPCIVWGGAASDEPIRAARITAPTSVRDALAAGTPVARDRWTSAPWHIDDANDVGVLDQLAARWPSLGSVIGTRWSRGVVTGCNKAFVIDGTARAELVAGDPAAAAWIRPFLKGRDIERWQAPTPAALDRYILLVDRGTTLAALPRGVRAHLRAYREALEPRPASHRGAAWSGRKPGPYKWHELQDPVVPLAKSRAPRLFYQDIQTAPACCLDVTGELVPDTTVWILPSADPFLLAVLNSPLYFWYARRRFPPALNGAVRPKLEYMRAFPLAEPAPALRAKVAALVGEQLRGATHDRELADLVAEAYGARVGS